MKHYKIVKKTYHGINTHGFITECEYRAYRRILWFFWKRLNGYTSSSRNDDGITYSLQFKNAEDASNFIYEYHKNRGKIGKCVIKTVEYITIKNNM